MLDALTETAGGDENDLKASSRMNVARYLKEVGFIDLPEKQPEHASESLLSLTGASQFRLATCTPISPRPPSRCQ